MKLSGNTVLITGGTSGIGYEFAAQLLQRDNTVIVTGRDMRRLRDAEKRLPGIHVAQSDVSNADAIRLLFSRVIERFPRLNMLINNAGVMRRISFLDRRIDLEDVSREIETDLVGTVRMVAQFLPHLKSQQVAAILNVSSGLAFVPLPIAPIYCAAKAGVHSFTQSLRVQLKGTPVRVFELAPPLTRTPLLEDMRVANIPGGPVMDVTKMVSQAIRGVERDDVEVRPGLSNVLNVMSRIAPNLILKRLSKTR